MGQQGVDCMQSLVRRNRSQATVQANRYSELFFLDEATSFAAGHRPCADCQRKRIGELKAAWASVLKPASGTFEVSVSEIDTQLHDERALRGGGKVTFTARASELPDGTPSS
jgi:hypothetical protein